MLVLFDRDETWTTEASSLWMLVFSKSGNSSSKSIKKHLRCLQYFRMSSFQSWICFSRVSFTGCSLHTHSTRMDHAQSIPAHALPNSDQRNPKTPQLLQNLWCVSYSREVRRVVVEIGEREIAHLTILSLSMQLPPPLLLPIRGILLCLPACLLLGKKFRHGHTFMRVGTQLQVKWSSPSVSSALGRSGVCLERH